CRPKQVRGATAPKSPSSDDSRSASATPIGLAPRPNSSKPSITTFTTSDSSASRTGCTCHRPTSELIGYDAVPPKIRSPTFAAGEPPAPSSQAHFTHSPFESCLFKKGGLDNRASGEGG